MKNLHPLYINVWRADKYPYHLSLRVLAKNRLWYASPAVETIMTQSFSTAQKWHRQVPTKSLKEIL